MGRIAKWKQIPEEEFAKMVAESFSFRELSEKVGYAKDGGGATWTLKQAVKERNLDTSHFLGQGINKGKFTGFEENSPKKRGKSLAHPLIEMRGHKCEKCQLTEWQGVPITLQVHHIDGDRTNNKLENLQLLCPNCHSLTDNFCRKGYNQKTIDEEQYVLALKNAPNIHTALKDLGLTPTGGNYERARRLIDKYGIKHLQGK